MLSESAEACSEPAPVALARAVELFNRRAYYACHDALEALWLAEARPIRLFYQGLLQVGVALHHEERGNRPGAVKLLAKGMEKLVSFAPECHGLDVTALLTACTRAGQFFDVSDPDDPLPDALHPVIHRAA